MCFLQGGDYVGAEMTSDAAAGIGTTDLHHGATFILQWALGWHLRRRRFIKVVMLWVI